MTDTNQVDTPKLTEAQVVDKFKALFNEIYDLEQDLKEVSEEAKDAGLDAAGLKEISKAIVYNKISTLEQKFKDRLELIERVA